MLRHGQSLYVHACIVKVLPIGIINRRDEECERYKGADDSSKVLGMVLNTGAVDRDGEYRSGLGSSTLDMPGGHLKNRSSRSVCQNSDEGLRSKGGRRGRAGGMYVHDSG